MAKYSLGRAIMVFATAQDRVAQDELVRNYFEALEKYKIAFYALANNRAKALRFCESDSERELVERKFLAEQEELSAHHFGEFGKVLRSVEPGMFPYLSPQLSSTTYTNRPKS